MAEVKQAGLEIQLDEQIAEGIYSNFALINHSTSEFVIDFATVMPGMQKARVKSRIVLTPEHAKRLLRTLQENIALDIDGEEFRVTVDGKTHTAKLGQTVTV